MQSYDLSHLPQLVHDALLHLMEALVQACSPASENNDGRRDCEQRSGTSRPSPEHATALTPVTAPGPQHQRRQRGSQPVLYNSSSVDRWIDWYESILRVR